MPMLSSETGSRLRRALRRALVAALMLGFATVWGGCRPEHANRDKLRESKRVSDCRWNARRDCHYQAKEDASLDKDACVSDRSWQCALGTPEEPDDEAGSAD